MIFLVCVLFGGGVFPLTVEETYKRLSADEIKVLYTFLALTASAGEYALAYDHFPSLEQLTTARKPVTDEPYLEKTILEDAAKAGYAFTIVGEGVAYFATAAGTNNKSHAFYKDERVLCVSDERGALAPVAHAKSGCPEGFSEIAVSRQTAASTEQTGVFINNTDL